MYHPSLTWEAVGVLCWAQNQPTFTLKNLLRTGTGRDRAYRIVRELLLLGFVERFEHRDESGRFLEYGYRVRNYPLTGKPETGQAQGENPEPTPLVGNPLTAHPEAAECVSCKEQIPQDHFPLTEKPEAAPPKSSEAAKNVSLTQKEPLTEKAETAKEASFFKSLKEEIKEEIKDLAINLKRELKEELIELLVNSSLSKKKSAAKDETPTKSASGKPDAVAELAASLGLSDWQRNFARAAVREEKSRAAWFTLARNHPEVLKTSYRLLDKTGQRSPVAWVAWLPYLAEDVQLRGSDAVRQCMEKAITSASAAGAWGYYRACVQGGSRTSSFSASSASAYDRLPPEYRIVKRIPGKETVYAK